MKITELISRDIVSSEAISSEGEDFVIVKNPLLRKTNFYPYKSAWITIIVCEEGQISGSINLQEYVVRKNGFMLVLPEQILSYNHISEEFKGYIILLSNDFSDSILSFARSFSMKANISRNPYFLFTESHFEVMKAWLEVCLKMVALQDCTDKLEVLRLLSQAFFLGIGRQILHIEETKKARCRSEELASRFIDLVPKHFHNHRELGFYADLLCVTPKYLSASVKSSSGKTASDWINHQTLLEAQALLVSTDMSVGQISTSVGFPTHSGFGKFFRRHTGLTPQAYRKKAWFFL